MFGGAYSEGFTGGSVVTFQCGKSGAAGAGIV